MEKKSDNLKDEKTGKVVYKSYHQNQIILLPPSLEEIIPENHLVRVVNLIVDGIELRILEKAYKGGGTSSYHPKMMLKILMYAYSKKIYSCRRIAAALHESVYFMWLSAMQKPDFRTINNFRSGKLKSLIEDVFNQVLQYLIENSFIKVENYFVDGTKVEADANKFTYVWSANTKRYKKSIEDKVKDLLKEIDKINEEEDKEYGEKELEEMGKESELTSESIKKKASQINENIKNQEDQGEKKSKIKKLQRHKNQLEKAAEKLAKYEVQEKLLNGRRSYSKTDPDATFMRLKDDRLLPAYNVMIGTEDQYIINYTISQSAGESHDFVKHMQKFSKKVGRNPKNAIGDAGFGSEENYDYLKKEGIGNYLKYSGIYKEQTAKYKNNPFHKDNFKYDENNDEFICPNNRRLKFKEEATRKNANGYKSKNKVYECEDCTNCQFAKLCKKGKLRKIQYSPNYDSYKAQVRENYRTVEGEKKKKQRGIDVETPFGDIKHNQEYKRFRLRGLAKVKIEWGLLSICHNIRKVHARKAA